MSVRRSMRAPALREAKAWAVVESVAISTATVRLATNGARLTDLQMMAPVSVGQKVIVDFVSEDKPTVRPYTTTADEYDEDETLAIAPSMEVITDGEQGSVPELSSRLVAGQATRTTPFSYTFIYNNEWLFWPGTNIPFTSVNYDWGNQMTAAGLQISEPGRYMISLRVASTFVDNPDYWSMRLGIYAEGSDGRSLGYTDGVQVKRWHDVASGIVYLHWQGLLTATAGALLKVAVRVQGGWAGSGGAGDILPVTFPVSQGRYPIFQWWRICPMIGPQSYPYWFYRQA